MQLRDMLLGDDAEVMRQYCIYRFDVDIRDYKLKLCSFKQTKGFPYNDDGCNIIAIKNIFSQLGVFKAGGHGCNDLQDGTPLHVFFIHLEETDDMIERLKKDDHQFAAKVARSKLPTTLGVLRPIDRTAMIVAGF